MSSYRPPVWPVSVKAVVLDERERVLLLHNERDEWELPGGRLEIVDQETGEAADLTPRDAVARIVRSADPLMRSSRSSLAGCPVATADRG